MSLSRKVYINMAFPITMSKNAKSRIKDELQRCVIFRLANDDEIMPYVTFTDMLQQMGDARSIAQGDFPMALDFEIIDMTEGYMEFLEHLCDNAIDAKEYAMAQQPLFMTEYLKSMGSFATTKLQQANEYDAFLLLMDKRDPRYSVILREMRDVTQSRLNSLRIDCSQFVSQGYETRVFGSPFASYNANDNKLYVFPLSILYQLLVFENKEVSNPSKLKNITKDFIANLTMSTFAHELTHTIQQCEFEFLLLNLVAAFAGEEVVLKALRTRAPNDPIIFTIKQHLMQVGGSITALGPDRMKDILQALGDPQFKRLNNMTFEEYLESIPQYGSHCTAFKLTLLYLMTEDNPVFKINMFNRSEIRDIILKQSPFAKSTLPISSPQSLLYEFNASPDKFAYEWETKYIRDPIRSSPFLKFKPSSTVVKTNRLKKKLIDHIALQRTRTRSNFKRSETLTQTRVDNFAYAYNGEANLLKFELEEDAFSFLANMVLNGEPTLERDIDVDLGSVGLYLMCENEGITLLYSDGEGGVGELNVEEAWWVLSL